MRRRPPRSTRTVTRFPYTTLFRSQEDVRVVLRQPGQNGDDPSFHEVVVSDRFRRLTPDELLAVAGQSGEVTRHTFADAGRHFGKRPGIGELTEASDVEAVRSEEHTSELQSLMRITYAGFCLNKKHKYQQNNN